MVLGTGKATTQPQAEAPNISDSGSNGRAAAVASKLESKDEAPPFPDPQGCPFCVPHPRRVVGSSLVPRGAPSGRGHPRGCPTTSTTLVGEEDAGRQGEEGHELPGTGSTRDLSPHTTPLTALPQDVRSPVCVKAPHLATNTHMLSNIIS